MKPDAFHQHEVLHTIFLLQENLEQYVLGNELFTDPRFLVAKTTLEAAQSLLNTAYQEAGSIELLHP